MINGTSIDGTSEGTMFENWGEFLDLAPGLIYAPVSPLWNSSKAPLLIIARMGMPQHKTRGAIGRTGKEASSEGNLSLKEIMKNTQQFT